MEAYVLIQTHTPHPVAETLREIYGITNAEDLSGPYDAIARADITSRPIEAIVAEVLSVPRVSRALVAPVVNSFSASGEAA
jgi:hypothetical protein